MKFARLKLPHPDGTETTIYGWLAEGEIVEAFATHPYGMGTSSGMLGKIHSITDGHEELSQAQFNAAYLLADVDELEGEEATLSLGELDQKYPEEG